MTTAVIYACPHPTDADQGTCEEQVRCCREYAGRHCWSILHVETDEESSAAGLGRTALWNAIQLLRPGGILLVDIFGRLASSVFDAMTIEQAVRKARARIVSLSGETTWKESGTDQIFRTYLLGLAESQRDAIRARTKAAVHRHQYRDRRRMTSIGREPWGWMTDPCDLSKMIPCQSEIAIAQWLAELNAAGIGWRRLARMMNAARMRNRASGAWYPVACLRIVDRLKDGLMPPLDDQGRKIFALLRSATERVTS